MSDNSEAAAQPAPEKPAPDAAKPAAEKPAPPATKPAAEKPTVDEPAVKKPVVKKPAAKPPRELPTEEQLALWVEGNDLPSLENLFNLLSTKLFDGKVMQLKKQELLPQHWQVITRMEAPADEVFDGLTEVRRLAGSYDDPEVARRRVEALRVAWRELRGKRPSLWNASDLFAALRRIVDKKREVAFHEVLSATRDVWRDLTYPQGREQLEVLWACLDFIRSKTRK